MKLWCATCHTEWNESVRVAGEKCYFKDCDGWLTSVSPQPPKPKPKPKPTYPLLEKL